MERCGCRCNHNKRFLGYLFPDESFSTICEECLWDWYNYNALHRHLRLGGDKGIKTALDRIAARKFVMP